MKKETFEAQKAFAGEKKPSMLRRCIGHDYKGRQIYMITMVTEGRRALFGQVVGRSDAPKESMEAPHIELSELGQLVAKEWWAAPLHHPEVEIIALQMMPDHLHGILFVKEKMEKPLGMAIRGFKQSCNRHYRELVLGQPRVSYVALATQHTEQQTKQQTEQQTKQQSEQQLTGSCKNRRGENRTNGLLFARGYNDKILLHSGQLDTWLHYLSDNPRRLLLKREHPNFFRVQRNVEIAGMALAAIGNSFLLERPVRLQVQCSRSLTVAEIQTKTAEYLSAARQGAVLVSPAISPGEKTIMQAAFNEGLSLIFIQDNGFTDLTKPSGAYMDACAQGRLLFIGFCQHHNERIMIHRDQCIMLNEIARKICENN